MAYHHSVSQVVVRPEEADEYAAGGKEDSGGSGDGARGDKASGGAAASASSATMSVAGAVRAACAGTR